MKDQPEWVRKAYEGMDFITANVEREVTLEEVADVCLLSKFHFHRIFRLVAGETVAQFARRSRLQAAARRLVSSDDTITEVAHRFGFSSSPNFNRAVKKEFGVPPTQLRDLTLENITYPMPPKRKYTADMVLRSDPVFEQLPDYSVVYVRLFGVYKPIPKLLADMVTAYRRLMKWAENNEVETRPVISATWDIPGFTPEEQCRADACLRVPPGITCVDEGLTFGTLPGGNYLTVECQCYSFEFDSIYMALLDWMADNNVQLGDGPGYEVYQSSLPKVLTGNFSFLLSVPVQS